MGTQTQSISKLESYVQTHSRRRYEVNSDRNRGMMKVIHSSQERSNSVKEKKPYVAPEEKLKIIFQPKGKRLWQPFGPRIIDSNMEFLVEWNDSGKREYLKKSDLEKILGREIR